MKPERLKKAVADIFGAAGMAPAHAQAVAEVLVWADLRGMGSHGVMRVPRYVELLRKGDLNACPVMRTVSETLAAVLFDADRAPGPVAMIHAADAAAAKARQAGIGLALARNTTHTAALGYYTQRLAREGFAALAFAASSPNMAYHGARSAGVSTAPVSLAVPGPGEPLALDMASGVISLGKLMQARRAGTPLAPGSALDPQGNETTDPRAAVLPLPLGGPKGSGLALLVECLCSLLAGNPILAEALDGTPKSRRHYQNGLVVAIEVERFISTATFKVEVQRLAGAIKALSPQPTAEILLPGERGARNARERRDGIALPAPVLKELSELSAGLGVQWPVE